MRRTRLTSMLIGVILVGVVQFMLTPTPIYADTFTVNNDGDGGDSDTSDDLCDNGSGVCTLRAAIEQANVTAGADVINFSGVTLIEPASVLTITSEITINGTGVTVDSTGAERVFELTSATVIINGLTVTGGGGVTSGGGFYVSGGSLTLQNGTLVTGNTANSGGGIYALSSAQITITGSGTAVTANNSTINGGGLNLQSGTNGFLQNGAVISNHSGVNSGGGVSVAGSGSIFTVDNATVSGNSTVGGGGILAFSGGTVILQNGAVIRGNSATGSGGGINVSASAGAFTVSNTRFEGNTATSQGDAIYYALATDSSITHSCFTNNGDTAISNINTNLITASGGGNIALSNWWGTSWGPRIVAAGGGSAVSNGDSISGNGTNTGSNRVDVGLTDAGTAFTPPTGAWLTTPPTIGGVQCQVCSNPSGGGDPRACY